LFFGIESLDFFDDLTRSHSAKYRASKLKRRMESRAHQVR
jgi:hypothetical protein